MKAIFISDAHIRDHRDPALSPLLSFLDYVPTVAERLYIVGDLFDTWFAFPRATFDEYAPLLGALYRLRQAGVKIVYVTGNHDFEMGHYFTDILQAEIHDTEMVIEADGRRAYVAHGDMANPEDRKYRRMRRILRSRPVRWLGRNLPPRWVWAIAQKMTTHLTGDNIARTAHMAAFDNLAQQKFAAGFDTVILGHLHIAGRHQSEAELYVNLGEWIERRSFLRWTDGALSLERWTGSECESFDDRHP